MSDFAPTEARLQVTRSKYPASRVTPPRLSG